jgi:hypothetical protein
LRPQQQQQPNHFQSDYLSLSRSVNKRTFMQKPSACSSSMQELEISSQFGFNDAQRFCSLRFGIHVHSELLQL